MGLVLFTSLFIIALFVYNHFTKYHNYWKNQNVPGPEPTFFFGNFKDFFLRRKAAGEIFKEICDKYPKEKYVGIFRMRTPDLLVKDPDIINTILIKDFDAFVERGLEFNNKDLGTNLFHANGEVWRVLRNQFSTLFTSVKLKNMIHLMNKPADMLVDHIEQITKSKVEHDVNKLVKKFTQANIEACAFGLNINSFYTQEETLQLIEKRTIFSSYSNDLEMMYPGYRFATVQSKLCIAKLLTRFRVEPSKNTPRRIQATASSDGAVPCWWYPFELG